MLLSRSNKFLSQDDTHGEKEEEKERGGGRKDGILIKAIR